MDKSNNTTYILLTTQSFGVRMLLKKKNDKCNLFYDEISKYLCVIKICKVKKNSIYL